STERVTIGAAQARGPPAAGFTLTVTPTSAGVHLEWTANGILFQVRRSAFGAAGPFEPIASTTAPHFDDRLPVPGTAYVYQVVQVGPDVRASAVASVAVPDAAAAPIASADGALKVSLGQQATGRLALTVLPS